jgi:glycosyltransferase involved in cell wall biosynthesis
VYLEAMAAARPVVACRGQGIGEIIRHGENGVLVAPGEVDELADALAMLLGDASTRERLGVEARNTVVRSLTHAHQAERLERVYRACVP